MFGDVADYQRFLSSLERFCGGTEVKICAYCLLMENHIHLLVCDPEGHTSLIMKKPDVSYSQYFNLKYDRSGHLLQDRYKTEAIENNAYLLVVFRYILNNPRMAGICEARNYPWSSYARYDRTPAFMELYGTFAGVLSAWWAGAV